MAWFHALIAGLIAAAPGPTMIVTDHDASLPRGCRPAEVVRLGGNLVGKGAIDCEERRIVAWGAGASHERRPPPLCTRPAYATDAVLACVRHWR